MIRFGMWLRRLGVEAELFYKKDWREKSRPEWINPKYKHSTPEWAHEVQSWKLNYFIPERQVRREIQNFDLIFTTGITVIKALWFKNKPVVYFPRGSDFSKAPLWHEFKTGILSWLYRSRISRVDRILNIQQDVIWMAKLLGLHDRLEEFYFPVDKDRMKKSIDREFYEKIQSRFSKYDYVFFYPTRKNMDHNHNAYKGSDKFIKAFKKICDDYGNRHKICAVLGKYGRHVEEFLTLVDKLNFKDSEIHIVKQLPTPQLFAYMDLENTVICNAIIPKNQFNLSGIDRESLAMGGPLLTNIDPDHPKYKSTYGPNCPVLTMTTEREAYEQMEKIINLNAEEISNLKSKTKKWAKDHLGWKKMTKKLIEIFEDVLDE